MKYLAYLRKWFVYVLELAVLPFGILAVRWWWCRYNGSDTRSKCNQVTRDLVLKHVVLRHNMWYYVTT